ncbi:T-cell-specific surface glycoprotein CD28-like [Polyodon spathula]|uniref:T-cell-specific surface glycoprotein CD28-like n=1 Tax=Polyodon spathula TaxID=7913 RepID=UPI001B7F266D|nr:T-cell-specific surface glycoprotein CD28-like [Polyodon spathula]
MLTVIFYYIFLRMVCSEEIIQPKFIIATEHEEAALECVYTLEGKHKRVTLDVLKGSDQFCTPVSVRQAENDSAFNSSARFNHCEGMDKGDRVVFKLSSLQEKDTDMYYCQLNILYPPPFRNPKGTGTMIIFQRKNSTETLCSLTSDSLFWILITAIAVIVLYGVIISLLLYITCYKIQQNKLIQNEYMNMKPRGLKNNKQQGVCHPSRNGRY